MILKPQIFLILFIILLDTLFYYTTESKDTEIPINDRITFDEVKSAICIKFDNISQAREWGNYLKDLGVGEGFSVKTITEENYQNKLVIPETDLDEAKELTIFNFAERSPTEVVA